MSCFERARRTAGVSGGTDRVSPRLTTRSTRTAAARPPLCVAFTEECPEFMAARALVPGGAGLCEKVGSPGALRRPRGHPAQGNGGNCARCSRDGGPRASFEISRTAAREGHGMRGWAVL